MSILVDLKTGDPECAGAQWQTAGYALAFVEGTTEGIDFDPGLHRYTVGGEIIPSVTEILEATGVSMDYDTLASMGRRQGHAVALKRDIGTALHADAHAFDDQDLDLADVNPEVRPYLDAWVTFRENHPQLRPATRERRVYLPGMRYCGTLDGIFLTDGETDIEIAERWSVRLTPGARIPYRIEVYDDYDDFAVWSAFVTTYYKQYDRRKGRGR